MPNIGSGVELQAQARLDAAHSIPDWNGLLEAVADEPPFTLEVVRKNEPRPFSSLGDWAVERLNVHQWPYTNYFGVGLDPRDRLRLDIVTAGAILSKEILDGSDDKFDGVASVEAVESGVSLDVTSTTGFIERLHDVPRFTVARAIGTLSIGDMQRAEEYRRVNHVDPWEEQTFFGEVVTRPDGRWPFERTMKEAMEPLGGDEIDDQRYEDVMELLLIFGYYKVGSRQTILWLNADLRSLDYRKPIDIVGSGAYRDDTETHKQVLDSAFEAGYAFRG